MKVTGQQKEDSSFKPFSITIEFERPEEADGIFMLMNDPVISEILIGACCKIPTSKIRDAMKQGGYEYNSSAWHHYRNSRDKVMKRERSVADWVF